MDYKAAAVSVLEKHREWLTVSEIVRLATAGNFIPSTSAGTNEAVEAAFASVLYTDLCRKHKSIFSFKPDRDVFGLAEWKQNEEAINRGNPSSSHRQTRIPENTTGVKRKAEKRSRTMEASAPTMNVETVEKKFKGTAPSTSRLQETKCLSPNQDSKDLFHLSKMPQGALGSPAAETVKKQPTPPKQRRRKGRSGFQLTNEIAKISDVTCKLGEDNVLVGKMWLELSAKLKPEDLLLAEFALRKAEKVLQMYKKNNGIEVAPERKAEERGGNSLLPVEDDHRPFGAKEAIEQALAVAEQPKVWTQEQAVCIGKEIVKAASGGSSSTQAPEPTTLQNLAMLQIALQGILARSTIPAFSSGLSATPLANLTQEGLSRQQVSALIPNPTPMQAGAVQSLATIQSLQSNVIAASQAQQYQNWLIQQSSLLNKGTKYSIQAGTEKEKVPDQTSNLPQLVEKLVNELHKRSSEKKQLYDKSRKGTTESEL